MNQPLKERTFVSSPSNNSVPASWEELDTNDTEEMVEALLQQKYNNSCITTTNSFDERAGFVPKVRILKRDIQHNIPSLPPKDEPGSLSGPTLSIDEKQRRYDQARKKIFGQDEI